MQCPVAPAFSLSPHQMKPGWARCVCDGDPRVCGQSAQCVFQGRSLIAIGQRLAPKNKARTNFEKGNTIFIFLWCGRFLAQHSAPLGRPQCTCTAQQVQLLYIVQRQDRGGIKASSMQLLQFRCKRAKTGEISLCSRNVTLDSVNRTPRLGVCRGCCVSHPTRDR